MLVRDLERAPARRREIDVERGRRDRDWRTQAKRRARDHAQLGERLLERGQLRGRMMKERRLALFIARGSATQA